MTDGSKQLVKKIFDKRTLACSTAPPKEQRRKPRYEFFTPRFKAADQCGAIGAEVKIFFAEVRDVPAGIRKQTPVVVTYDPLPDGDGSNSNRGSDTRYWFREKTKNKKSKKGGRLLPSPLKQKLFVVGMDNRRACSRTRHFFEGR